LGADRNVLSDSGISHHNKNVSNPYFRVQPIEVGFEAPPPGTEHMIQKRFNMKATCLPIALNLAIMGHKLQGTTCKNIYAQVFSNKKNWNYVVLSRVKTRRGVYSRMPLPTDMDLYQVPQLLIDFLTNCRNNLVPSTPDQRHNFVQQNYVVET